MNKYLYSIFAIIIISLFSGCSKNDEPVDPIVQVRQSALVYAVNGNNLSSALTLNMRQMAGALESLPSGAFQIYVFKTSLVDGVEIAGLYKAVSGEDSEFELVKEYSRDVLSTDPDRLKEVINDYLALQTTEEKRTLFLWGHGLAWAPKFSDHSVTRSLGGIIDAPSSPDLHAFGGDKNNRDWMEIDELKEAIPSGAFTTLWFDCCYMSNIETIYELRDKCRYMVAYPTEIAANGLPYHHVLPHLFSDKYDLVSAAEALYKYYDLSKTAVTVTVMDMQRLNNVAKACADIYSSGSVIPSSSGLQNYSRSSDAFYDFGQYVAKYAELNNVPSKVAQFDKTLSDFVLYTIASEKDFNNHPIDQENYSGISTHLFKDSSSEKETYYRTLDWYKAVYNK